MKNLSEVHLYYPTEPYKILHKSLRQFIIEVFGHAILLSLKEKPPILKYEVIYGKLYIVRVQD